MATHDIPLYIHDQAQLADLVIRYLAIDIGGTNLRVGFIELLGIEKDATANGTKGENSEVQASRIRRVFEKEWPILNHLKNEHADGLFTWVGSCIAEVVRYGCDEFNLSRQDALPLGVTFSFPMVQHTLERATLMSMGKGFAITSSLDLGTHLSRGYETIRGSDLPPINIVAIANDAVATLVSFVYQSQESPRRKASMGLICGTGCNATIPLRRSILHRDKLPAQVKVLPGGEEEDFKVAVNTEWSINGTAPALRKFGLINKWDERVDAEGEAPGFQPLEYMTAGRYLGELGRLILLDYLEDQLGHSQSAIPQKMLHRFGLTTTFLSHFKPPDAAVLLGKLLGEFPTTSSSSFQWTEGIALAVYEIAKAIEVRAAGITAAATLGLLACAGDLPLQQKQTAESEQMKVNGRYSPVDLVVGYTGGCITHFQDYLTDYRHFLDRTVEAEFGPSSPIRVLLKPCHDGGITGAGVLAGSSQARSAVEM
ncbi:hypothetical protein BJ170DRAFT_254238 [Xylariales sp. AK1849]|nr:hypothetical protein BJ170DRAFT_254238 [Xylariales sp. AK1849]